MKIRISDKIVCIPPYISTTWERIAFLQSDTDLETNRLILFIHLTDGKVVKIPNIDASLVDIAFSAHMQHLEKAFSPKKEEVQGKNIFQTMLGGSPDQIFPIRFGLSSGPEGFEAAMQHNPAQMNNPPLPEEIVEKIASIARLLTNGDTSNFPKPEPHCNCVHCQVARALHNLPKDEEKSETEESVSDEDLKFRTWDITDLGDQLYMVKNPLDYREEYRVFLGEPIGCTCGEPHCEHIKAVLST